MPADHSKHGFLKDIGTDWVALSATGTPLARAATEDGVRRAVPDAAEYTTGKKHKTTLTAWQATTEEPEQAPAVEPVTPEPAPAVEPEAVQTEQQEPETPAPKQDPLDHDGNGRRGGSRRQRRPAA